MSSDHIQQQQAACNVALKADFPNIDDPLKAIDFAVNAADMSAVEFLSTWQEGAWSDIETYWPEYLRSLSC